MPSPDAASRQDVTGEREEAIGASGLRTRLGVSIAIALIGIIGASAPVQAAATEADRVVRIARAQLGDEWVMGAEGPGAFDCSGLVHFVFKRAGLLDRIGGRRMSARGYWDWFARRGRASRSNGRRGDLVIWGRGRHIGIYLGSGRAISTLVDGVRIHRLNGLTVRFTTFLHVRLERG